jgi:hypothetical protein
MQAKSKGQQQQEGQQVPLVVLGQLLGQQRLRQQQQLGLIMQLWTSLRNSKEQQQGAQQVRKDRRVQGRAHASRTREVLLACGRRCQLRPSKPLLKSR